MTGGGKMMEEEKWRYGIKGGREENGREGDGGGGGGSEGGKGRKEEMREN